MSKGEGKKIAIKFTEDLVGDVTGSKDAFTVMGKEYQYVNGPLVDKEYQVDKVERYPVQRVWELGEVLQLDVDFEEKEYGLNEGEILSSTSTTSYEMGWEFKVGNENIVVNGLRINPKTAGSRTVKLRDSSGTILRSVQILCEAEQWVEGEIEEIELQANTSYIISADFNGGNYRTDSLDRGATFHSKIEFLHSRYTSTLNGNPSTIPSNKTVIYGVVDIIIKGQQHYIPSKIHTSQAIALSGDYRVRWLEDKPINTNIVIEYTTGETQGQWQEVSNGDIITSDTNLWIRATLSTADEVITPMLQNLWLEEPDAPQDTILLTMDPLKRFNSVEGNLTVKYDASKGNLSGRGGAVESFIETFTPTDLVPKPNPGVAETIINIPSIDTAFTKVTYNSRYASDYVVAKNPSIAVVFTNVDDINP